MDSEIFSIRLRLLITATLAAALSSMAQAEPFFGQRVLQEVTFQVESPNDSSINQVLVRASTAEGSLGEHQAEADGTITNVEVRTCA